MLALIVLGSLLLDRFAGEPRRYHPLVGFGLCATWLESRANRPTVSGLQSVAMGSISLIALVLPVALLLLFLKAWLNDNWASYTAILDILIVYWAIGLRSLHEHIRPIQRALENHDNHQARHLVSQVASRDSSQMEPEQITSTAIETTIENGCDALFSVLFWYAIGGLFMVVIYRLINTLDAMWGYRTERFEHFGKAAARLDDIMNYVPARLTALTYGICGNLTGALQSWHRDAPRLESPNAGPVMAAGAGSLNIRLGGDAIYHGVVKQKPFFGGTELPTPADIARALRLVDLSAVVWCAILVAITLLSTVMPL